MKTLRRWLKEWNCAWGYHEHADQPFGPPLYPVNCDHCGELFYVAPLPPEGRARE